MALLFYFMESHKNQWSAKKDCGRRNFKFDGILNVVVTGDIFIASCKNWTLPYCRRTQKTPKAALLLFKFMTIRKKNSKLERITVLKFYGILNVLLKRKFLLFTAKKESCDIFEGKLWGSTKELWLIWNLWDFKRCDVRLFTVFKKHSSRRFVDLYFVFIYTQKVKCLFCCYR